MTKKLLTVLILELMDIGIGIGYYVDRERRTLIITTNSMRIYNNGVLVRDSEGRFTSFKSWVKKWFRRTVISTAIVDAVVIAFMLGQLNAPALAYSAPEIVDSMPAKIEALKDEVVEELKGCESKGYTEDDGIIILDSNKKMSIGLLMFQKDTVIHYYKVLYNQEITKKQAVEIALDDEKSSLLAKNIIFKDSKGVENWHNCATKLGLYQEVELIKKLTK